MTSQVEQLTLGIYRSTAAIIASSRQTDLREQLEAMAAVLTGLPGIGGAIAVALEEEGYPSTAGASRMDFGRDRSSHDILFELHQELEPWLREGAWIEVATDYFRQEDGQAHGGNSLALPVCSASRPLGLVLVAVSDSAAAKMSLKAIAESGAILAAAIHSAIRAEAWNRVETLQQIAWQTFARPEWDLSGLVNQLAKLFDAAAVTILLRDQEELRLAVSTDPALGRDTPVIYKLGEGLVGYVFVTGQPLRLGDTGDQEEIRRATSKAREGILHLDRDLAGVVVGQFLGVPMRFGGKVIGVLYISRRHGTVRFTREDERALQFFADMLGAALAPALDILLGKSVLESLSELIIISRREQQGEGSAVSRIVMANPGAERLLGRRRDEIEGMGAWEIYDPEVSDDIRRGLKPVLAEAHKMGHSTLGPIATELRKPDGTPVPVAVSYRFIANRLVSPPTLYTIALARDLTESEELAAQHRRLLGLLSTIRLAYFSADADGVTKVSTRADSEITGYSPAEIKAISRAKFFRPGDRTRLYDRVREAGGSLVRGGLAQMVRKNGELFWAEGDLRILHDSKGREIGTEGLYRDVTDRILLQGFLNADTERVLGDDELFEQLKRDAEFQLDYMSSLGHQLQTPLGSLVETLKNFETGVVSQKDLASRLPYVIGQAIVCTRLVRNLSYMDKILRNESFDREKVSLARLAIETKIDFVHLLKEKHLVLQVDDESLDRLLRVKGHREMLRQVVVNLVDNAIKYSLPDTIIQIRGRQWPEGPAFEITSQGLPIPEDVRETIFERGFRTEKARAVVPHGTGLGLWLVRKIVEAHGASIRCQEVLEAGEKRILFRILFPRAATGARRKL